MAKPAIRKPKKKANPLKAAKVENIDYKDAALLRKFISDRGKIRARRVTGVSVQEQRLIANAVKGVSEGYSKELLIKGIGYRARLVGRALELTVGFSHPVVVEPPEGITFEVPEPTRVRVSGIDKQKVGQVAANIRAIRKPSAYHEKGIYYAGEPVRLKPGKAGAKK